MEYSDNNFDIPDDDHDSVDFTNQELNRYFLEGHINSMTIMDEEEMVEDDQFNNQNDVEFFEEEEQEEVLSQKLSQLSTNVQEEEEEEQMVTNKKRRLSNTSTPDAIPKKMKMTTTTDDPEQNQQDKIPTYLSTTHASFKQFVQKVLCTTNSISMNDVQYMALLIHRIADLHIQKQVSIIYLQSGTGTLRESEPESTPVDRRVWPLQVTSAMLKKCTDEPTTMDIDPEDDHLRYVNFVHQRLQEMNDKIKQYQREFNEKKSHLIAFTATMEESIRNYVQQYGIKPLQLKRDLKIALLKHDYDAEIIERKFLQEQPNAYQMEIAQRLYAARNDLEKSKQQLSELKQRVFYNKPHSSYNSIQTSIKMTTMATDDNHQQQLLNKHENLIQRKKLDMMAIKIAKTEMEVYRHEKTFVNELSTMWQNHRNLVKDKGMSTTLSNLIEQRFTNIIHRWQDIDHFRLNYHIRNPYGDWEAMENKNNEQTMKIIGFQPRMIIDTKHSLTDKQLQLLNRGPTYVPPCQLNISSSSSSSSIDDILRKQYAPLKHQLAWIFNKYKVDVDLQFGIQDDVYCQFKKVFSMPIPSDLQKRAFYEKKLVQTIHQSLKHNNSILRRTADNMNTFYLGNNQNFQKNADEFVTKSTNYKVFFTSNPENNQQTSKVEINKLIDSINYALLILRRRNEIDVNLYNRLRIDATKVKLPYLYFLPDVSKENQISLVPIITSQHNVTYKISKYLDQLLRPFANQQMESFIFHDELEFIQRLNEYAKLGHKLTSTTLFCTIKVSNYFTLDTHESMINVVYKFIEDNIAANKIDKIKISTIKNLLQLCLYNNIFCYKDKIYTFTKGGPTTLPLLDTLGNIYLFAWQKNIADEIRRKKEFFGRYKNQIFFTWNNSKDELDTILQVTTRKYPNVRVQTLIASSVEYLNAFIANRNGQLHTRVYHHPTIQGYTLPYVVGHSKVNHSDWIRSALLRAVCYCSSIGDFNQERIYIELTCFVNGYSIPFVESRISHFYNYFHAETVRYTMDQTIYDQFRRRWFEFIDMQRVLSSKLQHYDDTGHLIRLHYLYEFGSRCQFNEKFHELWMKHFGNDPNLCKEKTAIILTTKHLHSLNALLSRQKSFCWLTL